VPLEKTHLHALWSQALRSSRPPDKTEGYCAPRDRDGRVTGDLITDRSLKMHISKHCSWRSTPLPLSSLAAY